MSWIWPDYVNRDLPLTASQRKAIHRDAWRLWWEHKWNVVLYLALPTLYLLLVIAADDVAGPLARLFGAGGRIQKLTRAASPVVLFIFCFALGGAVLQRIRFAPCVFRAIRQHGHDVCLCCGYWLKGLPDDVDCCPECGENRTSSRTH